MAPSLALAEDSERLLVRPRLMEHLSAVLGNARAVLLGGPTGIGRSTALQQWVAHTGATWVSGDERPAAEILEAVRDELVRGAVVVVGISVHRDDLGSLAGRLLALTEEPGSRVCLVLRGGPDLAAETKRLTALLGFAPGVVGPDAFHLTQGEISRLADGRSIGISDADVEEIHSTTGGYAAVVTRMLDHAVVTGVAAGPDWAEAASTAVAELVQHVGSGRLLTPAQLALAEVLAVVDRVPVQAAVELARQAGSRGALRELQAFRLLRRPDGGEDLEVLRGFRSMLRARAFGDLGAAAGRSSSLAQVLWDVGDRDGALTFLERRRRRDVLVDLLERNVVDLGEVTAGRLTRALTSSELALVSPSLVLSVARARVDITQAGHTGTVSEADCRLAVDLADLVAERDQEASPRERALLALVRGIVARVRGEQLESLRLLQSAIEEVRVLQDPPLHASVATQEAISHLSGGDYTGARRSLAESSAFGQDAIAALVARAGSEFVGRVVDTQAQVEWVDLVPVPRMRSYGRAYRMLGVLRTAEASAELRAGFGPIGSHPDVDPLVIEALRLHLETVIGLVSGRHEAALTSIDLMEIGTADRRLTDYERALVVACRAELLSASGRHEQALNTIGVLDDQHVFTRRIRARVLWEAGRSDEAAALIEDELASDDLYSRRQVVWLLVLHSLVAREIRRTEEADASLTRALTLASRTGSMIPFVRQGRSRLVELLHRAAQLPLDHDAGRFLAVLEAAFGTLLAPAVRSALSERERVVLLAASGAVDVRGLAQGLYVSPNTIKTQLRQIYRKLDVGGWDEAVVVARCLRAAAPGGG